jgi:hypothetical protein
MNDKFVTELKWFLRGVNFRDSNFQHPIEPSWKHANNSNLDKVGWKCSRVGSCSRALKLWVQKPSGIRQTYQKIVFLRGGGVVSRWCICQPSCEVSAYSPCFKTTQSTLPHPSDLDEWSTTDFGHRTIIALLSKGFRATSPLRFALMRQKASVASTFSKNCLSFTTEASGGEVWTV